MKLTYTLTFFDYWHLGNGLSAGAKLDSSVIKDKNFLPFAPGKSIKGLVREMAELLEDTAFVTRCFGDEGTLMGKYYFSNATLAKDISLEIVENKLQDNLYATIASTQVGENSVAVDDSLREIEVVIPLVLEGEILDIDERDIEMIKKALLLVKRMGLNRNRGLGRCAFSIGEVK